MTTTAQAIAAVRSVLDAIKPIALHWHGDPKPVLPDTPTAFAYAMFNNEGSRPGPTAFGGGQGSNLYRNRAHVEVYVFAPEGEGIATVLGYAETFAASLRSFRDSNVSCFSADVIPVGEGSEIAPPGLKSEVSRYQCAVAAIDLHFDQIG